MSKRQKKAPSSADFTPNRHVFLTGIGLLIMTIALVIYDFSIGEAIFDRSEISVLGERTTPTVTPYITPTDTPR